MSRIGEATEYDGATLRAAETERETKRQQIVAGYRARFIDGPVLTLQFRHMHVQFDPRNLQPLGDAGTVYPNLRISDDWGILEAKKRSTHEARLERRDRSFPLSEYRRSSLVGDGWTLELKPGWKIVCGIWQRRFHTGVWLLGCKRLIYRRILRAGDNEAY